LLFQEAYDAYMKNPLKTRFPGGESYFDLMLRLEAVLIDIEQHTGPVLVVSHISTLQVLYSYFLGVPIEACHELEFPFHSVLELIPYQDGWTKTVFKLR
jgi:broad specificity phosphatase PhoE